MYAGVMGRPVSAASDERSGKCFTATVSHAPVGHHTLYAARASLYLSTDAVVPETIQVQQSAYSCRHPESGLLQLVTHAVSSRPVR